MSAAIAIRNKRALAEEGLHGHPAEPCPDLSGMDLSELLSGMEMAEPGWLDEEEGPWPAAEGPSLGGEALRALLEALP